MMNHSTSMHEPDGFFRDHELNILKPKKHSIGRFFVETGPDSPVYLPLGLGWWESMGIHGNLWSMFNDVWWIRNRIMMSKMFKLLVGWWFVVGFMRLFDHIWSIVSCRGCSNVPTASVYNLSETFESKWPSFWRVDAMEGDAKSVLRSCQIHHNLVRGKTVWGKFFCVKSRWFSLNLVLAHINNLIILTRKVPGWWFGTFVIFFHILGISSSQLTNQPGSIAYPPKMTQPKHGLNCLTTKGDEPGLSKDYYTYGVDNCGCDNCDNHASWQLLQGWWLWKDAKFQHVSTNHHLATPESMELPGTNSTNLENFALNAKKEVLATD